MTGTEVARLRGICELSKGGNQAIETRRIPLFQKDDGVPGLVQPGMLVEVRDEQATWRGFCLATDISAEGVGASRVWQILRIERHYPGCSWWRRSTPGVGSSGSYQAARARWGR
ncbi:hypothetical protein L5B81_19885 [Pseudomonas aeruginosa]|uniref:hypothetical protein n=1 Tax=Pseudomonas aeruginosa TaxID=287 RepID=UPI001F28F7D3|nr:hypothetical protein [Pseudomonas aeruginosa]MDG3604486.1 hypothetical protein [Pseudomonas aeruginosa]MDG3787965.1 hypothetical protein [Pseudomonas aeruginosa]MDG4117843.1 hypothetical protein [Pseudomonas aeruginosa]MDG4135698.1 hypothetical protein [Pseudomonas aeruginosa]MDG4453288.1 hypothetical protein [Pseudomonas aeruginosa]